MSSVRCGIVCWKRSWRGYSKPVCRSWKLTGGIELEKECERQWKEFNEENTQSVTVKAPYHSYEVLITRHQYEEIVMPIVDYIRNRLLLQLARLGMLDTGSCIAGPIDILLVGENSRFVPLRGILKTLQQKPLDKRIVSYVDDAETFGAAVAAYLDSRVSQGDPDMVQLVHRLQIGSLLDMDEVVKVVNHLENGHSTQSLEITSLSSHLPPVAFRGELCMGFLQKTVRSPNFLLVFSTAVVNGSKVHCVQLQQDAGQKSRVFLHEIIGHRLEIFWERIPDARYCLRLVSWHNTSRRAVRGVLTFLPGRRDDRQHIRDEYDNRYSEMLQLFPRDKQVDPIATNVGEQTAAFVALVSRPLSGPTTASVQNADFYPSIVTVYTEQRSLMIVRPSEGKHYFDDELQTDLLPKAHWKLIYQHDAVVTVQSVDHSAVTLCFPDSKTLKWFSDSLTGTFSIQY
ncbi:uncharacterized protein LOC129584232 [Paramacrobiotus metropolitanus]|uniref:uncharacterized protein LOC129584232 n=1 Tax=Paramacrobiotus metropolitanus TaxID=2943436 RepID=UPI0024456F88|nr:uncharacterized protein LOC129584232 [Paramacrobiotus metropolitanus]